MSASLTVSGFLSIAYQIPVTQLPRRLGAIRYVPFQGVNLAPASSIAVGEWLAVDRWREGASDKGGYF